MASNKNRQLRQDRRAARRSHKDNVVTVSFENRKTNSYSNKTPAYLKGTSFEPKTEKQAILASTILAKTLTFAIGPSGTGKTHCPVAVAIRELMERRIDRIILTKPGAEVDEELGTEPGDAQEKIKTRMRSMRQIADRILGESHVDNLVKNGKIIFEPLGSVTGLTFDDAFIIIDEAQLATPNQMKSLITRIGNNSKLIICGDHKEQNYLNHYSGLEDALNRFVVDGDVGVVEFDIDDVVRSGFCKKAIQAYRKSL